MRNVILLVVLAGCVHVQLSPDAEKVRVTSNAEAAKGCTLLGNVEGTELTDAMVSPITAEDNANKLMRNKVATMGGNLVLVTSTTTTASGSRVRGEAYKCQPSQ